MTSATRVLGWFAVFVLALVAIALISRAAPQDERANLNALYCAGRLVAKADDPYLFQPLSWCERSTASRFAVMAPEPAPGYDLAIIAPLTALPFRVFALACFAAMAVAFCVALGTLATLTNRHPLLTGTAFAPLAIVCARHGELFTLVCVSALCLCAFFLSRKRFAPAAIAAAVAMCQPEFGLPAALSLLIFAPRTRPALVAAAVVLAVLSIAVLGVSANVRYFLGELPRHARAEIAFPGQYGIPWIVHALGARTSVALAAGFLVFILAIVLMLALANAFSKAACRHEALVLIPPLAAVCAGISVYEWSVILAIPAALVFSEYATRWRAAAVALVLVAVPWQSLASGIHLIVASRTPEMAQAMTALHSFPSSALSSTYWQVYLQNLYPTSPTFSDFAWKLPTWLGLALVLWMLRARELAWASQSPEPGAEGRLVAGARTS